MEEKIKQLKEARTKLQEALLAVAKTPTANTKFYQYDSLTKELVNDITNEIRKLEKEQAEHSNQIRIEEALR